MRGQVNSFPPHGRHINDAFPGLWPLRFRRLPLIRQQQQQCCCYLIYKLPVLWRSGAAARLSRLHTPVETGTPPRRRGKLHYTHSRLAARVRTVPLPLLSKSETLRSRWRLCRLYGCGVPLAGAALVSDLVGDTFGFGIAVTYRNTFLWRNVLRFRDIFHFQVFASLTISFTGVTLARTR